MISHHNYINKCLHKRIYCYDINRQFFNNFDQVIMLILDLDNQEFELNVHFGQHDPRNSMIT